MDDIISYMDLPLFPHPTDEVQGRLECSDRFPVGNCFGLCESPRLLFRNDFLLIH